MQNHMYVSSFVLQLILWKGGNTYWRKNCHVFIWKLLWKNRLLQVEVNKIQHNMDADIINLLLVTDFLVKNITCYLLNVKAEVKL